MTPSETGARAEAEVTSALVRDGWQVFLPVFAGHSRVDLIALRSGALLRVQVKAARLVDGRVLRFRVCSNTANVPRDYSGEVDAFGVFSPELCRSFLVPVDAVGATRACHLRLGPTKSGQVKGTRLAADFELRPPG